MGVIGADHIRVVLFDLGGVLFQLAGVRDFGEMIGESDDNDVLNRWVTCPWVQRYDRGECSSEDFAAGMVSRHRINLSSETFLERFRTWVPGPKAGAQELVQKTKASGVTVVCLSNTNEAHWKADNGLATFVELFDHRFLSFEIGFVKPESNAFAHVVTELGCEPSEILFLDDVQVNVEAARNHGIDAICASDVDSARDALEARGLLPSGR